MKIYEITQPKSETIVFEDLANVKADINRWAMANGYPQMRFSDHMDRRKIHGRTDDDPTTTIKDDEIKMAIGSTLDTYGDEILAMQSGESAVMKHKDTDINIPFVVDHQPDGRTELIVTTIMKDPNFRTGNKVYQV